MDAPPSEGDTRSYSDDDFRTRHTAGTCGGADTLVGEPLHGAEGRAHPCRDSRPADGAFQVYARLQRRGSGNVQHTTGSRQNGEGD